jgi:hypothetical protein
MAQNRKSIAHLEASGTLQKNRGRYQARIDASAPSAVKGIGRAPHGLTKEQKAIWRELIRTAPANTLQKADRIALEMMTRSVHRVRFGTPTMAEINFVAKLLGKFAMTPIDRERMDLPPVQIAKEKTAEDLAWDALEGAG